MLCVCSQKKEGNRLLRDVSHVLEFGLHGDKTKTIPFSIWQASLFFNVPLQNLRESDYQIMFWEWISGGGRAVVKNNCLALKEVAWNRCPAANMKQQELGQTICEKNDEKRKPAHVSRCKLDWAEKAKAVQCPCGRPVLNFQHNLFSASIWLRHWYFLGYWRNMRRISQSSEDGHPAKHMFGMMQVFVGGNKMRQR